MQKNEPYVIHCQNLLIIYLLAWFKVRVREGSRPLQKLLHMAPSAIPITAAANIHCHSGEQNHFQKLK